MSSLADYVNVIADASELSNGLIHELRIEEL